MRALVGKATGVGEIVGLIHAAGVSPSQASPDTILHVDLYGTAVVLEEFGNVIARGGAGVVIASQSGHRLGALTREQNAALATTPAALDLDVISNQKNRWLLGSISSRLVQTFEVSPAYTHTHTYTHPAL